MTFLAPSEKVIAAAGGNMRGHITGLIALTNKNIFMVGRSMIGARGVETFPLTRIGSISVQNGVVLATLRLTDGSTGYSFENMQKPEAKSFLENCQSAITAAHEKASQTKQNPPTVDFLADLERLADLFNKGHLTEAEFAAGKQKLLHTN